MKTLVTFALLLVLGVSSAPAQQVQPPPPVEDKVQLELLELSQDVDKTLLKEALLILGRKDMKLSDPSQNHDIDALKNFIEKKQASIVSRSAEIVAMKEKPVKAMRERLASQANQRVNQPARADREEQIEKMEAAQVETQLLQRQVQLYQQSLNFAVEVLANAEVAAGNDEKEREKAVAARKEFEKAKSKYVEFSKKFQMEQGKLTELQQQLGFGGMGGMGGMGGGFR